MTKPKFKKGNRVLSESGTEGFIYQVFPCPSYEVGFNDGVNIRLYTIPETKLRPAKKGKKKGET